MKFPLFIIVPSGYGGSKITRMRMFHSISQAYHFVTENEKLGWGHDDYERNWAMWQVSDWGEPMKKLRNWDRVGRKGSIDEVVTLAKIDEGCSYVFQRGKNKGEQCSRRFKHKGNHLHEPIEFGEVARDDA